MKNVIFSIAIAICAMIATSCTSESEVTGNLEQTENPRTLSYEPEKFKYLSNEIEAFSKDFRIKNPDAYKNGILEYTRGNTGSTEKLEKHTVLEIVAGVVFADAKAFLINVFNKRRFEAAATASINKFIVMLEENKTYEANLQQQTSSTRGGFPDSYGKEITDSLRMCHPAYYSVSDSVILYCMRSNADSSGYYHNAIVASLYDKHKSIDNIAALSKQKLILAIDAEAEKVLHLPTGSLQNDRKYNTDLYKMLMADEGKTIEETICEIRQQNVALANVLDVIHKYLKCGEGIEFTSPQWRNYSEGIYDIIENSDIDKNTKKALGNGLSVAFASSRLWNFEIFKPTLTNENLELAH